MKLFKCIVDDGENVFKEIVPAKNKKELLSVWGGNGNFEKIEDVTKEYPIDIDHLREVLQRAGYGVPEERLICELVEQHSRSIK